MNESDESDYLWDKSGEPDPQIAQLENLLAPLRHEAPLDELRLRRPASRRVWWVVAGVVAMAATLVLVWWRWPASSPCGGGSGFTFEGVGGDIGCGDVAVARGVLPVGTVLDTGKHEATLAIANIGTARLGAGTRVRLDATSPAEHRLHLERGRMHARVTAPPRLFAITTPSTAVTDLGCEYAIEIDAKGAGSIKVISGKVELQARQGLVIVAPAGTHAAILPGERPGLPVVTDASVALADAVAAYERGEAGAVRAVLAAATERDAITLANLAIVEPGSLDVLQRLGALAPSAAWTIDVAMSDPGAVAKWREEIVSAQIVIDSFIDR